MNEKHPVIPGLVRKPQPRTAGGDIYPHLPERGATLRAPPSQPLARSLLPMPLAEACHRLVGRP